MIAALTVAFRIGAALLLIPLAVSALAAGNVAAAVFTLAVLALCCNGGESDKR